MVGVLWLTLFFVVIDWNHELHKYFIKDKNAITGQYLRYCYGLFFLQLDESIGPVGHFILWNGISFSHICNIRSQVDSWLTEILEHIIRSKTLILHTFFSDQYLSESICLAFEQFFETSIVFRSRHFCKVTLFAEYPICRNIFINARQ